MINLEAIVDIVGQREIRHNEMVSRYVGELARASSLGIDVSVIIDNTRERVRTPLEPWQKGRSVPIRRVPVIKKRMGGFAG